jgi:hypothetical protein
MNDNLDATGKFLTPDEKEAEQVLPVDSPALPASDVKDNLTVRAGARQRGDALDHVLLHGRPDGRQHYLCCNELGVNTVPLSDQY